MTAQPGILGAIAAEANRESGGSTPAPAPTPTPTPAPTPAPAPTPTPTPGEGQQQQPQGKSLEDLLADLPEDIRTVVHGEVTKARTEAQNLRKRMKDAEPQLQQYQALVEASQTDAERAAAALAATEARAEAANQRVARAEIKAALAGVVDNPDAIIEDLNLAKFVDDDGEVDAFAVQSLAAKFAVFSGRRAPRPDSSQGSGSREGAVTGDPEVAFAQILQKGMSGG
jgi:hypothetical protein